VPVVSVYRREQTGEYTSPLAMVAPSAGYVDRTVTPGQNVCYVARTVVAREPQPLVESAPSDEVCLSVRDISPPAAPTGIAVLGRGDGVEVSWSPSPEADLDRYRVYRAVGDGAPERLAELPVTETSYLDRTLPAGATARYSVTAIDTAGNESAASAAAEGRRP
jgi:fibronectin type 3 domain-containing protein